MSNAHHMMVFCGDPNAGREDFHRALSRAAMNSGLPSLRPSMPVGGSREYVQILTAVEATVYGLPGSRKSRQLVVMPLVDDFLLEAQTLGGYDAKRYAAQRLHQAMRGGQRAGASFVLGTMSPNSSHSDTYDFLVEQCGMELKGLTLTNARKSDDLLADGISDLMGDSLAVR